MPINSFSAMLHPPIVASKRAPLPVRDKRHDQASTGRIRRVLKVDKKFVRMVGRAA